MPDSSDRDEFAKRMWLHWPEADDAMYHHGRSLPAVSDDDMAHTPPVCVHVAALGYSRKQSSLKPPPGTDLFGQLLEQYLLDGFMTSGDPLLVVLPEASLNNGLQHLWMSDDGVSPPLPVASIGNLRGWRAAAPC